MLIYIYSAYDFLCTYGRICYLDLSTLRARSGPYKYVCLEIPFQTVSLRFKYTYYIQKYIFIYVQILILVLICIEEIDHVFLLNRERKNEQFVQVNIKAMRPETATNYITLTINYFKCKCL